jgi:hypothetical protein
MLLQAAEVNRVEHVAVEDQASRRRVVVEDRFEKPRQRLGLAVVAPQVQVRNDNRVQHAGIPLLG